MAENVLVKVPPFKYTSNEFNTKRKKWVSTMYPLSTHFLDIVKRIDWKKLGFAYYIFGGAAYEMYNMTYATLTDTYGFNLHTYADPTSDIDVAVAFLDPDSLNQEKINEMIGALYDAIAEQLEATPYFTKFLNVPEYSETNTTTNDFGTFLIHDEIGPFILGLHKDKEDTSYRIRLNYKIGDSVDHSMEFLIDKELVAHPLQLHTGLMVRDLYFELYRNIHLIDEWYDDILLNRTDFTVKVINHIGRFTYGFQLLNILYAKKDPILDTLPEKYVNANLVNILMGVMLLMDKYKQSPTKRKDFELIEEYVVPIIKCPSSEYLHTHILNILPKIIESVNELLRTNTSDIYEYLSPLIPISKKFINTLTNLGRCKYGTIKAGGKRSRKRWAHTKRIKK